MEAWIEIMTVFGLSCMAGIVIGFGCAVLFPRLRLAGTYLACGSGVTAGLSLVLMIGVWLMAPH